MTRPATTTALQVGAIVIAIAVALVLALSGGASASSSTVKYTTTPASVTTLSDRISASGTVQPNTTIDLSFSATTLSVTSVSVHAGQSVKAGQVLATVDATAAKRQLTTAQAQYAAAKAAAANTASSSAQGSTTPPATSCTPTSSGRPTTRPTGQPTPSMRPTPHPTPSATPTGQPSPTPTPTLAPTPTMAAALSRTQVAAATTPRATPSCATSSAPSTSRSSGSFSGGGALTLSQAQTQLATAQAGVAATTLKAPQSGVIQSVDLVVGALPGSPAVVMRADGYQVVVSVAEQDAPFIKVGQVGTVTFTAISASSPATVIEAPTSSSTTTTSGSVASFSVIFAVTTPPSELLPGMSATVTLTAASRTNVLTVPTSAIQSGDVGYFVRVLVNGQPQNQPVQLGLSTTSLTEVTHGLRLGAPVITGITTG